jgi:hypothetical protein
MSLSDLASIESLASRLAVLVSRVYLSLQVKQAERIQLVSIKSARAIRTVDLLSAGTEPSTADVVPRNFGGRR